MQRVTGIGGVFFKARDADGPRARYERHLGLDIQDWGGLALPPAPTQPSGSKSPLASHTTWCVFPADSDHFGGTRGAPLMINYRVALCRGRRRA